MKDNNPFGDSQSKNDRSIFVAVLDKLLDIKELKHPFTLIIRDLVDNSFV
jgi:C4-type Zn-finger protein